MVASPAHSTGWMLQESLHPTADRTDQCLKTVRLALDIPSKYDWAIHAWEGAAAADQHSFYVPPKGVPYFFKGAGQYGHIVLVDTPGETVGETLVWSTDIKRKGKIDKVTIAYIEKHWGMKGLGWTTTLNDVRIMANPK